MQKDQWDEINYSTLTQDQNETIRTARRNGFAVFYPNSDEGDKTTFEKAVEYLKANNYPVS